MSPYPGFVIEDDAAIPVSSTVPDPRVHSVGSREANPAREHPDQPARLFLLDLQLPYLSGTSAGGYSRRSVPRLLPVVMRPAVAKELLRRRSESFGLNPPVGHFHRQTVFPGSCSPASVRRQAQQFADEHEHGELVIDAGQIDSRGPLPPTQRPASPSTRPCRGAACGL